MSSKTNIDLSQVSVEALREELAKRKENKKEEIFNKLSEALAEAKEFGIEITLNNDPYTLERFEIVNGNIVYFENSIDL